jgi:alcohol dehydrogenase class IV
MTLNNLGIIRRFFKMEFNFFANSLVQFGQGKIDRFPELAAFYGNTLLLITGAKSFQKSEHWQKLLMALEKKSITVYQAMVKTEPSPVIIDDIVRRNKGKNITVIAAIGGGSVIDAGKAVSAMMTKNDSVIEYLEGVGNKTHDGKKIPFIALPTTSGTGSEATKNAVISLVGGNGFKKSLRHDNFVPDIAIVDPALTYDCPPDITAACGMDALTQLLESYVSTQSSIITDSLALGALEDFGDSLIIATREDVSDIAYQKIIDARTKISYASYISGLTLANAGLGVVHGFASVIGGLFEIPHGVICGTLLCEATRHNIESLIATDPKSVALGKYARVAGLLNPGCVTSDLVENSRNLVTTLAEWTEQLNIPGLSAYGLQQGDIEFIVNKTKQKNNPAKLSNQRLSQILQARL